MAEAALGKRSGRTAVHMPFFGESGGSVHSHKPPNICLKYTDCKYIVKTVRAAKKKMRRPHLSKGVENRLGGLLHVLLSQDLPSITALSSKLTSTRSNL